jgi:hypothetical protein
MALINQIIPEQNFEIVRNRIASILVEELQNQNTLDSTFPRIETVYADRVVPFDKSEVIGVNVRYNNVDYSNHDENSITGDYEYYIDINTIAQETDDEGLNADSLSATLMNRIIGKIIFILSSKEYYRIGFDNPPTLILNRHISRVQIAELDRNEDGLAAQMGRIYFKAKFAENVFEIEGQSFEGTTTNVTVLPTDKGLEFTVNNN